MGALSNYLEQRLLDHTLAGVAYAPPAVRYVSLHTANPGEDVTASTEVTGGSYQRALAQFRPATNGASVNDNTLAFSNMPAVTVTHVAVYDGSTAAANPLYYGALTAPVAVTAGGTFVINAAGLTISLD